MNIEFNAVSSCSTPISYEFDGMIGIAPRQFVDSGAGHLGPDVGFMD